MLWWEIESPEQAGEPLVNVGHDDSRGGAREEGEDGPWAFKRPASERVQEFQAELRRRGVWASVRVQRGDDQSAACGMLATGRQPLPPGLMPL